MQTSKELTEPLVDPSNDTVMPSANNNSNNNETQHVLYTPVVSSSSESTSLIPRNSSRSTVFNFILMAVLFSANHGCTVACLSLATARLGAIGAWQSGTLYLTYTASAVLGATYITKRLGGRNAIISGMMLYCIYVACFLVATSWPAQERLAALTGAAIGGVGGGFLWTAQGAYFTQVAGIYAHQLQQDVTATTTYLAGVFAFIYLSEEVILRTLSTILLQLGLKWSTIFAVYSTVAVVSTLMMGLVQDYPRTDSATTTTVWYKVTAAAQLLWSDPKMKYMIGLNAVFGFAGAFLNSYVNGEVVRVALHDQDSKYVGILSGWLAAVAAIMSLVFSRVQSKGTVLVGGAICFFGVALPFLVQPDAEKMGWGVLIMVYTLQGTGRATFESTLKATFADYFSYEKEGAFANVILQNGLSSAVGYVLSFRLLCSNQSKYCVEYRDGSLHDVLSFELLVCVTATLAIFGYWRASSLNKAEQDPVELVESEDAVDA